MTENRLKNELDREFELWQEHPMTKRLFKALQQKIENQKVLLTEPDFILSYDFPREAPYHAGLMSAYDGLSTLTISDLLDDKEYAKYFGYSEEWEAM